MAESRAQLLASLEHNLKLQERLYEIEVAGYKKEPASVQLRVMLEQLEIKYGIKMDTASRRDAWFKFLSSPNAHADRLMREIVSAAYNTSSQDWDRLDSARKQLMTTEVATEIANLYSELSKDVHGRSSHNVTLVPSQYIEQHFNILRGMLNFCGTRYYLQVDPDPRFSDGTAATASLNSAIEQLLAQAAQKQAQQHVQQQAQPPQQQHEIQMQMQMQMPSMQMMPATQMLPLPAGWVAGDDGSGHTYYYNSFFWHLAMGVPWAKSFCPAPLPVLAEVRPASALVVGPMIVRRPRCIHPIVLSLSK